MAQNGRFEYDPDRVIGVACEQCMAPPGKMCVSRNGNVASEFHVRRKAEVYPHFMRAGTKRGVRKIPITIFGNLPENQKRVLISIAMMNCGSIALDIPKECKLSVWKPTIELIEMGIVEIFIGESKLEKDCAAFRLRMTEKGKDIWRRANI